MFHDLGLPEDRGYDEDRACHIIHTLVNDTRLEARVMERLNTFLQDTSITYDSKNVPTEKKKRDAEDVMRHMYLGYTNPCTVSEEDYVTNRKVTVNGGYAFLYALDLAVQFGQPIEDLLEGKELYDPLLFKEKMVRASSSQSEVIHIEKRADFKTGEMPHKLVVYAVDKGAGYRAVMTYEQIADATAKRMTSIGRYGLVPGGIVGGNFHRTIFGSIDRADLCMLNYDSLHQAAVLCPVDRFASRQYNLKRSIAVMVNGNKTKGLDIIVTSAEKELLPFVSPRDLVLVVPTTMLVIPYTSNIITYNPADWGNFHQFNEWLQTTSAGVEILEHALGRKMSGIRGAEPIF